MRQSSYSFPGQVPYWPHCLNLHAPAGLGNGAKYQQCGHVFSKQEPTNDLYSAAATVHIIEVD